MTFFIFQCFVLFFSIYVPSNLFSIKPKHICTRGYLPSPRSERRERWVSSQREPVWGAFGQGALCHGAYNLEPKNVYCALIALMNPILPLSK